MSEASVKLTDEQRLEAPWLKRSEEDGQIFIRKLEWDESKGTGTWVRATPEDIATGIMASNVDEYRRAGGRRPAPTPAKAA